MIDKILDTLNTKHFDDKIPEKLADVYDQEEYKKRAAAVNPYGDGRAVERIIKAVNYHFGISSLRPQDYEF